MIDPKKTERAISSLNDGFMGYPLLLGILVSGSDYFRKLGINAEVIESYRPFERSCYLWGFGRTEEDFSAIGLGSRRHYAKPLESKRSWLSHPRYSTHTQGVAFDMALGFLFGNKITKLIWSKKYGDQKIYEKLSELADSIGLKSFHKTYGQDSFHFEIPLVHQGKYPLCFGFVVINALQKKYSKWRNMDKKVLYNLAVKLGEEVQNRSMKRSAVSALEIAKEWGWVRDFEVLEVRDVRSADFWSRVRPDRCLIIEQRKNLGIKNLEGNNGINGHTYLFHQYDHRWEERIFCRNSHYDSPIFPFNLWSNISNCIELHA